jgi:hypothetical protein
MNVLCSLQKVLFNSYCCVHISTNCLMCSCISYIVFSFRGWEVLYTFYHWHCLLLSGAEIFHKAFIRNHLAIIYKVYRKLTCCTCVLLKTIVLYVVLFYISIEMLNSGSLFADNSFYLEACK